MKYPQSYNEVETIQVQDKLSHVLGTFSNGLYEFNYTDVVKSAGHSCPTVAGAYLMTQEALKKLYTDTIPVRGDIKVEFKEDLTDGVAGVIANVITQITGATDKSGFKGLNGKFARHSLMNFNSDINSSARFTRVDTNQSVDVYYNPSSIKPSPDMQPLMQKIMQNQATKDDIETFGKLWQDRVRKIFENSDEVIVVK